MTSGSSSTGTLAPGSTEAPERVMKRIRLAVLRVLIPVSEPLPCQRWALRKASRRGGNFFGERFGRRRNGSGVGELAVGNRLPSGFCFLQNPPDGALDLRVFEVY